MFQSQTIDLAPRRRRPPAARPARVVPPAQSVRPPRPDSPGHRWTGTFYCQSPGCHTVLAEVFVDEDNHTYLPQIGGGRVFTIGIECQHCKQTRIFTSIRLSPNGGLPAPAV
ncbi:MAG: hypothetical protein IT318_24875 [Anaerolineales bacterium]|nr:hypothetical protein [Anaerolineales bacterium]